MRISIFVLRGALFALLLSLGWMASAPLDATFVTQPVITPSPSGAGGSEARPRLSAWPTPTATPAVSTARSSTMPPLLQPVRSLSVPPAGEFPISALPLTSEEAPSIDGNRVVWFDDRSQGPTDVWGYDLAGGKEFQVTSHGAAQLFTDISGDVVVYEDNRNGTWDIYATRLSTGEVFAVATGPGHQRFPRIWEDYIVYHDETGDYWQADVYLYQISISTTFPLAVAAGFQGDPDIDNGWVVWRDNRENTWQVRGYRIEDNTYHLLEPGTECRGEIRHPRVSGNTVVWQNECFGWPDPGYDILGYDLVENRRFTVFTGPGQQEHPAVSDHLIVWQDRDAYGNWDVFVYVRADGTVFPVTLEPSQQINPAVSGNTVVWQDNRNHTWDVYGFVWDGQVPPASAPKALSNPRDLHVGAYPQGAIRLSWTDNITNELGFVVQRAEGIFGTEWHDWITLPANTTVYTDVDTTVGESYWYRVRAYNDAGDSSYSNESYSTAFDAVPNLDERYMHVLINEARMDPGAWGYPDLAAVNPLGWHPNLAYSARAHALGMNNSNGRLPETAFKTIGEAIPHALFGDTIQVAAGHYQEQVVVPAGVSLVGEGWSQSVIDAGGAEGPVVRLGADSSLQGFTIQGSADGYFNAGVWIEQGAVVVRENRITGNAFGVWAWFESDQAQVTIEGNIIDRNSRGGVNSNEHPVLIVRSNTVVQNDEGGVVLNHSAGLAENNLIIGNGGSGLVNLVGATVRYNDVWGNGVDYVGGGPGEGGLSMGPMFRDMANGDYRLHAGSPAIGRGTPAGTDVGALPFTPKGTPPSELQIREAGEFQWEVTWSESGAQGYHVYIGTSPGLYSYRFDAGRETRYLLNLLSGLLGNLTYYVAVTGYDDLGDETDISAEVSFSVQAQEHFLYLPLLQTQ